MVGITNLVGDMFLTLSYGWGVKGDAISMVALQGLIKRSLDVSTLDDRNSGAWVGVVS